jgi:broad specificity phosphatase PhoE
MTNPISISFVRHGQVYNPQEILYGRLPRFRLSEEGRRQAQATAGYLQARPFAALFSSPMLRARQTAKIILAATQPHLPLRISTYLNEVYVGVQGRLLHELEAQGWDIYTGFAAPYEQPGDILRRVQKFVAGARRRYPKQRVVAVTHGDPIVFMMLWARRLPFTREGVLQLGLPDAYPVTGSIVTFTYKTDLEDEIPGLEYVKP